MRWLEIVRPLHRIIRNQEKIMSALEDITAANVALKEEVGNIGTQMDQLFAAYNAAHAGGDDAAIAQVAADIQAQVQALKDIGARDALPAPPQP